MHICNVYVICMWWSVRVCLCIVFCTNCIYNKIYDVIHNPYFPIQNIQIILSAFANPYFRKQFSFWMWTLSNWHNCSNWNWCCLKGLSHTLTLYYKHVHIPYKVMCMQISIYGSKYICYILLYTPVSTSTTITALPTTPPRTPKHHFHPQIASFLICYPQIHV